MAPHLLPSPAVIPQASYVAQDTIAGLVSVLSDNAAALITGAFALLAVMVTQRTQHEKRRIEWTWDKAYEALTELDREHREVTQDLTQIVTSRHITGTVAADQKADSLAVASRFATSLARCRLLTNNRDVQARFEALANMAAKSFDHVHMAPRDTIEGRKAYPSECADLLNQSNAARLALMDQLNGNIAAMTRKR